MAAEKRLTKLKVKRNGEPLLEQIKSPAIGALKAAAKPALAPLLIKIFLQTWCFAAIDYSLVQPLHLVELKDLHVPK